MKQLKLTKLVSESHIKAYFFVDAKEMTRNGLGNLIMEIFDLNG